MMWLLVLVLWPLAELFVIVKVAEWIGFFWMLVLLVASWPLGTWLLRAQGRTAMRRFRDAVAGGRVPAAEAADGALTLCGGLLLLVPGFITDVLGLLLLVPPLRRLAGKLVSGRLAGSRLGRLLAFGPRGGNRSGGHRPGGRDYDVESTAYDADDLQLRPHHS
jgi:UPF0716 protein FxsA